MAVENQGPTHRCVRTCFYKDNIYHEGDTPVFDESDTPPEHFVELRPRKKKGRPPKSDAPIQDGDSQE